MPPSTKETLHKKSELSVTDSTIRLPKWLAVVLVVGAFTVGGAWAALLDARHRVGELEQQLAAHVSSEGHPLLVQRVKTLEQQLAETKKKQDENTKVLQELKSDMRAVCTAVKADCGK